MGKSWGRRQGPLGTNGRKMGRTSGFRESPLTLRDEKRNLFISSETKARRTSSDHRKVEAREAQRDAARRNGGKPREHRKVGSRDGSEPRKGSVTGVGWKLRTEMVRGAPRRLPWSRQGRHGRGLSDTTTVCCQRAIEDAAPRSTGGLGRTVTRGCVASRRPLPAPFPVPPRARRPIRCAGGPPGAAVRVRPRSPRLSGRGGRRNFKVHRDCPYGSGVEGAPYKGSLHAL